MTPPHEPLERKDQASDTVASDSIVRNAAFAAASTAIGAAFSVALTLYLVRALDPHGYGTFTLAIAIGALFAVPMDLGVSSSAARFVAEHRGERTAIAAIVASALRLKLAVSHSIVTPSALSLKRHHVTARQRKPLSSLLDFSRSCGVPGFSSSAIFNATLRLVARPEAGMEYAHSCSVL